MRRSSVLLLLLAIVAPAAVAAPPVAEASSGEEALRLPHTVERVWYRTDDKRTAKGRQFAGDLTLTEDGIEIDGKKGQAFLPAESIRFVSHGTMRGDVNTVWTVLSMQRPGSTWVVGLKDGRKLGFGDRTAEIYDLLRRYTRQLGVGPYVVPPGHVAYDRLDRQFAFAHPEDWYPFHRTLVEIDEGTRWGTMIFAAEKIDPPSAREAEEVSERRRQVLKRVDRGEVAAFFVDRRAVEKGMDCDGLSAGARKRLLEYAAEKNLLGKHAAALDAAAGTDSTAGGCAAVGFVGTSGEHSVELVAVTDGVTLMLFGSSVRSEIAGQVRDPLDTALSSLFFAAASKKMRER
ncbi:MAG: hypothetical protein GY716_18325 [bacterium]|nr:hypothetical protein [bacterium]